MSDFSRSLLEQLALELANAVPASGDSPITTILLIGILIGLLIASRK